MLLLSYFSTLFFECFVLSYFCVIIFASISLVKICRGLIWYTFYEQWNWSEILLHTRRCKNNNNNNNRWTKFVLYVCKVDLCVAFNNAHFLYYYVPFCPYRKRLLLFLNYWHSRFCIITITYITNGNNNKFSFIPLVAFFYNRIKEARCKLFAFVYLLSVCLNAKAKVNSIYNEKFSFLKCFVTNF